MKFDYSLYLVTDRVRRGNEHAGKRPEYDGKEMRADNGKEYGREAAVTGTDDTPLSARELCGAVGQAILGGCTMVQLREKNISSREFYYLARELKRVTDDYHVPLIINDRIDIALSVEAAGVHIGQNDIPASVARKIIRQDMLLGVSAASAAEAVRAWRDGADYLGVGAMFPTKTKSDARPVSAEELAAIREAVPIPIVAIGGINRENAAGLMAIGIDGIAVISAVLSRPDIRKAARELRDVLY